MAHEVTVPRLGWSMDEGTFGEWLKRDGEFVDKGQALFVLEGEKSAQDIESFDSGILRIPPHGPKSGDTVKVGQVLAYLVAEGESAPFGGAGSAAAASSSASPATKSAPAAVAASAAPKMPEAKPANQPAPAAVAAPVPAVSKAAVFHKASPRARRRAAELGIDWGTLTGSGSTGRIRERDVVAATKGQRDGHSHAASLEPGTVQPVSRLRKTIATRMLAGAHETAPVTLTIKCNATNLASLRQQFRATRKSAEEIVPDYNDLIVKLTALVLADYPALTARWSEREIVHASELHLAVAVDTPAGLLAPVVRNVPQLPLRQLSAEIRRLAAAARDGKLPESELQGGVFTITNLGMFGIEAFTPIINLPQVAILGVGAIIREPAVIDDEIEVRERVTFSLTFDHRAVDGAPAARFLAELRQAIEQPGPWLMA